jgi:hypothetical protein
MPTKPHLKLTTQNIEVLEKWNYKPRFVPKPEEEEEEKEKDYTRLAFRIDKSIKGFNEELVQKQRNYSIDVPTHIDHIQINFFDSFNLSRYSNEYLKTFGLEVIRLTNFNRTVLFAISDSDAFNYFITHLELFVRWANGETEISFDRKVLYVQSFQLLSLSNIISFSELRPVVKVSLIEGLYNFRIYRTLTESLLVFLKNAGLTFDYNAEDLYLEIENPSTELINDIVNNFDVIHSVTSSLSTVIAPSQFKIPERGYGFEINNFNDTLPLVGIIDTGVDAKTPLNSILHHSYDYTNTSQVEDNADHGTGVAALAALGRRPYEQGYRGIIETDARLISLKVMDSNRYPLKNSTVISAIRKAKADFPDLRIFVLTITQEDAKKYNEAHSDYAYQLDKLTHELDILIFISIGNLNAENDLNGYDLTYYDQEKTNLQSPAESMNNITVGANADNLESGTYFGISPIREFPSLVTRSNHLRLEEFFTKKKINRHIRKPDFILPGGDYEQGAFWFAQGLKASLQVISSDPTQSFMRQIGTSYAAPLGANLALRVQRLYPELRSQSIKALLINSCDRKIYETGNSFEDEQLNKIIGAGLPDEHKVLYSNENSITFILERSIRHKELMVIPIKIPDYLTNVKKNRGLLKFTLTMCFAFLPDKDNQLAYCPNFVAFSIFRNATPEEIKLKYATSAKLRNSFSQDGYALSKPPIYSNVQKLKFSVSREDIISENGTFMVAIHSFISPHIKAGITELKERIKSPLDFSLAISIEEDQPLSKLSNRLYNEIVAINDVENILSQDLDIENEAEN